MPSFKPKPAPVITNSKVTLTLIVDFDVLDADTLESITALIDKSREYGAPVKATITGVPPTFELPV